MTDHTAVQLSLDVKPYPGSVGHNGDLWLIGTLKVAASLPLSGDLQPGAELTCTIADADGNVLTSGSLCVDGVAFRPLKDQGATIGTERVHKASVAP